MWEVNPGLPGHAVKTHAPANGPPKALARNTFRATPAFDAGAIVTHRCYTPGKDRYGPTVEEVAAVAFPYDAGCRALSHTLNCHRSPPFHSANRNPCSTA